MMYIFTGNSFPREREGRDFAAYYNNAGLGVPISRQFTGQGRASGPMAQWLMFGRSDQWLNGNSAF
jgi:hypothetical protein